MVFLREPRLGHVKTRLSRHLNKDLVLDLYRASILDTIETVEACNRETLMFVEPPSATPAVAKWLGDSLTFVGQEGKDLGERMGNGFAYAFSQGFQRAILVGSDTPDLPQTIIEQSLDMLETHQAVIGPSVDGGYYLIGFSTQSIPADVFTIPTWGTNNVFSDTVSALFRAGCPFQVLPEWADIDELPDLIRFLSDGGDENCHGERTRGWARRHRGTIELALTRMDVNRGT